jgi:integrase
MISHEIHKSIALESRKTNRSKTTIKAQGIYAIRIRLELKGRVRDLALFNLAIDSKLGSCDLISLKVKDVTNSSVVSSRAMVIQKKTNTPVQFEITKQTQRSVELWIRKANLKFDDFLFKSRMRQSPHISKRQYSRIVKSWVSEIGLDPAPYGTHSLRRTKATLIYRRTKNLRAVQLLLGHKSH